MPKVDVEKDAGRLETFRPRKGTDNVVLIVESKVREDGETDTGMLWKKWSHKMPADGKPVGFVTCRRNKDCAACATARQRPKLVSAVDNEKPTYVAMVIWLARREPEVSRKSWSLIGKVMPWRFGRDKYQSLRSYLLDYPVQEVVLGDRKIKVHAVDLKVTCENTEQAESWQRLKIEKSDVSGGKLWNPQTWKGAIKQLVPSIIDGLVQAEADGIMTGMVAEPTFEQQKAEMARITQSDRWEYDSPTESEDESGGGDPFADVADPVRDTSAFGEALGAPAESSSESIPETQAEDVFGDAPPGGETVTAPESSPATEPDPFASDSPLGDLE